MKILYLSQILPYPIDAGPKARSFFVLSRLAQHAGVSLLSFTRAEDPDWAFRRLKEMCQQVLTVQMRRSRLRDLAAIVRSFARGRPFLIVRDEVAEMDRRIEEALDSQSFDAIHADQLWMAPYALKARQAARARGGDPRLVLDQHNAVHLIPGRMAANARNPLARWLLQREARLMARLEVEICRQFDEVVWVTQEDFHAVEEKARQHGGPGFSSGPCHTIIPICIDPDRVRVIEPLSKEPVIFFLGGMHWPPNAEGVRWFVQEILPRVQAVLPEVKFLAAGKAPPAELLNKRSISAAGFVEDVEPYWKQGRVFVVPLRAGGGMRVKILDAWAHGTPVISTGIGAEGLKYVEGENILLADSAHDFANALIRVLCEVGLAERLGRSGRSWVEEHYDWKRVYSAWDAVYPAAAGSD